MGAPGQGQELDAILEAERHVVAGADAQAVEDPRDAVGLGIQFGERHGLAGSRHDDGQAIGGLDSPATGVLEVQVSVVAHGGET